jgi:alanyl-tRNA synthetase
MHDQSPSAQISSAQTWSHNVCGGGAIGIDDQSAQITAMTITERPQMGVGVVRIPVTFGCQPRDGDALIIDRRLA